MSKVEIKPVTSTSLLVGKKVVYKTMDEWIAVSELKPSETAALARYKDEFINKGNLKPATYNI